jgi:biopolymer transport protein ExbD
VDLKALKSHDADDAFELNLAPMLAMMVCLIPILLLSVVFVNVSIIETPIPQVVEKAIAKDRKKKDRDVEISLSLAKEKGFKIKVIDKRGKNHEISVAMNDGGFDYDKLHSEIVKVKIKYPDVFRLELMPADGVSYDEIVKTMDEVRKAKKDDPKVTLVDEETKKKVETDILFPDVVFANVVEG